jgi:hypothetical protein
MSWTISDVDSHKQGLSDTQKRQWVRIANDALKKYKANGTNDEVAAAIRKANGAVRTNLKSIITTNKEYTVRREVYNNRTHIVLPVTMMVEGVHNGSHGPLYHPAKELGAAVDAWNGVPVTIDHPESGGEFVSVTLPGIEQRYSVGRVFSAHMEDDRLRAEIWVDETKLTQKSPEALRSIDRGELIEVSVGVFSDDEQIAGEWNGETYNAISRNHRPDHLALLPRGVGACSVDDGCGVRANKEGGEKMPENENVLKLPDKAQYLTDLVANVESIQNKLDAMDTDLRAYYLTDVYPEYFVYEVRSRDGSGQPMLYKRDYTTNEDGTIEFVEEPAEVRKQVTYVTLQEGGKHAKSNVNQKEVKMPNDKKPCDGCEPLVNALITNEKTTYTEDDREWLSTFEEDQLTKLVQNAARQEEEPPKTDSAKKEEPKNEAPQLNAEQAREILKESLKTNEDFLELMPEDLREQMSSGLRLQKEARARMVKSILDNTDEGVWDENVLKEMKIETLERVYKSVAKAEPVGDYSLQGEGPTVHEGVEPLMRVVPKAKEA